jgi:hypothetical protein
MTYSVLSPALLLLGVQVVVACPFCTAVKPSLGQQRDEATVTLLADVARSEAGKWYLTIQKIFTGADRLPNPRHLTIDVANISGGSGVKAGQLALVLATPEGPESKSAWQIIPLDETSYAYVARSPSERLPAAKRLPYYAEYLEHANPLIAEDAYREFGNASYDEVALVTDRLPFAVLRRAIEDPHVPEARQGFYGLALGLAKSAADRRANETVLQRLIDADADDFRAGFDGVLGGYLMLTGTPGLIHVEKQLLANPQARSGDLRHAATALRFVHEFDRGVIPDADLRRAMRRLLTRPETAPAAIIDLARWRDWDCLNDVVALFSRAEFTDPATTAAVVGYLLACPRPAAVAALTRLREQDPQRVADAEIQGILPAASH